MFIFIPKIGGNDPIWRSYFSHGLVQPPTSFPWWMALILGYLHTYKCYDVFFGDFVGGHPRGLWWNLGNHSHDMAQTSKNWPLMAGFLCFFNHLEIKFRSPKLKCFFRKTCLETWIDHGPFWDSWFDESWNSTGLTQTTLVPGMAGGSWCM